MCYWVLVFCGLPEVISRFLNKELEKIRTNGRDFTFIKGRKRNMLCQARVG